MQIVEGEFSPSFDLSKQYVKYMNVLKGAKEGEVVTRFPPEPSGYLHIGHVKAALLNYHYSRIYKGRMILRFDDTNPAKENNEFVESIKADLQTIGVRWDRLTYSSDYFAQLIDYGRTLIKKGLAYCDGTNVEEMREQRNKLQESAFRNATVEENLALYELMVKGQKDDFCLRAKIDYLSKNGCLRDPVLARTNKTPHHRTGTKFTFYPTYDFACPVIDSIEGVTHALRTIEYRDRAEQYAWVQASLQLRPVTIYEFSKLSLQYTLLSKRKLTEIVNSKKVEGWSDPRFPTIRGVLRRGIRVETLTEFMLDQGPSKNNNLMEWEKLWAINKRIIDPLCPRIMAVTKKVNLTLKNGPSPAAVKPTAVNPLNAKMGTRPLFVSRNVIIDEEDALTLSVGEKVTLKNWGNFLLEERTEAGLEGNFLPEDQDFKTTKKISWLASDIDLVDLELIELDHLIVSEKIDDDKDVDKNLREVTKYVTRSSGDPFVRSLKVGDVLQIERRGYYRLDRIRNEGGLHLVYELIFCPDGKVKGFAITTEVERVNKETNESKQEKRKKEEEDRKKEKQEKKKEKEDKKLQKKKQREEKKEKVQKEEKKDEKDEKEEKEEKKEKKNKKEKKEEAKKEEARKEEAATAESA